MTVFHVAKNTNYTVMSNHHLRNRELSLKAKGLLSQMLSLSEKWDYTLQGLAYINREQIDAIRQAVHELEEAGYIVRTRERDSRVQLRGKILSSKDLSITHSFPILSPTPSRGGQAAKPPEGNGTETKSERSNSSGGYREHYLTRRNRTDAKRVYGFCGCHKRACGPLV